MNWDLNRHRAALVTQATPRIRQGPLGIPMLQDFVPWRGLPYDLHSPVEDKAHIILVGEHVHGSPTPEGLVLEARIKEA